MSDIFAQYHILKRNADFVNFVCKYTLTKRFTRVANLEITIFMVTHKHWGFRQ